MFLLISCIFAILRCQKEFEKDYMEKLDREKLKIEFELMEMKLGRRSLGNIG